MSKTNRILVDLLAEIRALRQAGEGTNKLWVNDPLADMIRPQDLANRYPNLGSLAQIRWWIHHREQNGLDAHRALVKKGKSVWIIVPRFRNWLLGEDPEPATDSVSDADTRKQGPSDPLNGDISQSFRKGAGS